MYAASIKYDAARMAGLTLEDPNTSPNIKYRYIIKALDPSAKLNNNLNVKTATVFGIDSVDITSTYTELPLITTNDLKIDYDGSIGKVELKLKYKFNVSDSTTLLSNHFGAFYVERQRFDSTAYPFKRINITPLTKGSALSDYIYHTSFVPNLRYSYKYRIVGLSYFDEERTSPEVIISVPELNYKFPQIENVKDVNGSSYNIKWEFYDSKTNMVVAVPASSLTKQKLYISSKYDTLFTVINNNIPNNVDNINILKSSIASSLSDSSKVYYYKLKAITVDGDTLSSNAFHFKTAKKSRPAIPTGLTASESTTSNSVYYNVKVEWDKLLELGYQLYRRIGNDKEKMEVTGGIKYISFKIDSLSQKMEYPPITYYLVAFDENYNPSDTLKFVFTKPNNLRPISPIIKSYTVDNLDVTLDFELSPSNNIANYYLYRTTLNDHSTQLIPIFDFTPASGIKNYTDLNLVNGQTYIYCLIAKGKGVNGKESCYEMNGDLCTVPGLLVPVKVLSSKKDPISLFKGELNLDFPRENLSWVKPTSTDVVRYELFKNETNREVSTANEYTFWKSLPPETITLTDFEVKFFSTYQYGIRAVYKDGTMSPMSTLSVFLPNKEGCVSGNLVITNNTTIPINTTKNDVSCFEIRLKDGFNYKASVVGDVKYQYNGKIVGN